MANYVKSIPRDAGGEALQEFPAPFRAIASVMMRENAAASSAMAIDSNATSLEVGAIGGSGVAIRWVASAEIPTVSPRASVVASGLGANFDHLVPAGTVRRFAIPRETGSTLYQRVAIVNAGITASSVLVVQY